jgi:hypothetical protein
MKNTSITKPDRIGQLEAQSRATQALADLLRVINPSKVYMTHIVQEYPQYAGRDYEIGQVLNGRGYDPEVVENVERLVEKLKNS